VLEARVSELEAKIKSLDSVEAATAARLGANTTVAPAAASQGLTSPGYGSSNGSGGPTYTGPRGSLYTISPSGRKVYKKR
jgi:hypothetical protein